MKKITIEKIMLFGLMIVFISLIAYNNVRVPLDFDSAFNLNVVKNFVNAGIYGTSVYLVDGQKYYWFDPWISTGPSVLLPISLFVSITKSLFIIPRFVMNIFFLAFIYFLSKFISKHITTIRFFWIIGLNIAIVTLYTRFSDRITNLALYVEGEIPGYTYTLIALLGFLSNYPFVMGLFLGLALLTKMQLIFLCGPLFLGGIYYYKMDHKKMWALIISFLSPLFLYSVSLVSVFGKGIRQYYGDFKGVAIMQKATPSFNIHLVQDYPVFFILALISILMGLIQLKRCKVKPRIIILSCISFLLYFILIWRSNSAGHVSIPKLLCVLWLVYSILNLISFKSRKFFSWGLVLSALILMPTLIASGKELQLQRQSAEYLQKKYSRATFYNIGWWKSPELQVFMNKDVIRLDKKNNQLCKKECYLLVSQNQENIDPDSFKETKKYTLVEDREYFNLYKMR